MEMKKENAMPLPPNVHLVWKRLHEAGHEAYVVGGCVRDFLRGVTPHDYDMATSATPTEVMELFSDMHTIPTGIAHGTVTVIADKMPLEVTTFRIDGDYADMRHPDGVRFTDCFREDCARRDFTVNAMGYAPDRGFVDFFGGCADLQEGVIRTVGDAKKRFGEDALRILRALRFSSVLGFSIHKETDAAIHEMAPLLAHVANERVYTEVVKLLTGKDAFRVCRDYADVITLIFPELAKSVGFSQNNRHHCYDVYMHTLHALNETAPDVVLRLATLFHDAGKPSVYTVDEAGEGHFYGHAAASAALADEAMLRLRADSQTRHRVVELVRHHDDMIADTPLGVKRYLSRHGEAFFFDLLALKRADNLAQAAAYRDRQAYYLRLEGLARQILFEKSCLSIRDLSINGDDVIQSGVPKGPMVGQVLQMLLDKVLVGEVANSREALLAAIDEENAFLCTKKEGRENDNS